MRACPRWLPALLLGPLLLAGCKSSSSSGRSGALASITIACPYEARVRLTVIEVFEAEQYHGKSIYSSEMVFERPGNLGAGIMHGSWMSGIPTERVRIRVVPSGPEAFRIDCNAYVVRFPDDRVMEEEHRIHSRSRYEKLLARVQERVAALSQPPGASAP